MGKKSSQGQSVEPASQDRPLPSPEKSVPRPRSPAAYAGIQVNFCKNPVCANFGVPISGEKRARLTAPYRLAAAGKGFPLGFCIPCNESFPLKSNKGIHEELE